MNDTTPLFSDVIHWPDGMNEQVFLNEYWQKKPLLIRQAFQGFDTPLPADELAGLSLEPDTTGKIITQDEHGAYHLEHGPFEQDRFASLTGNQWSLLVTDVEKHLPEFIAYLQPFRFIPDWRIDDLMVSYAPKGASVGAHVDAYDVFLLQASGIRTWHIDARQHTDHQMRSDGDLNILANFQPNHTWDLVAGDMLYLPPDTAHHGIANSDDCTTWSIGFRAPRTPDFIARIAELVSDKMDPVRYRDGELSPARYGEICIASIKRFKSIWEEATRLSDDEFKCMLGQWLTESSSPASDFDAPLVSFDPDLETNDVCLEKAPFSRFAWIPTAEEHKATLFADGLSFACSSELAQHICTSSRTIKLSCARISQQDRDTLKSLTDAACLLQAS